MDISNIRYYLDEDGAPRWHDFDEEWVFYMDDAVLVEVTASECMTKGEKTLYAIRTESKESPRKYRWVAKEAFTARESLSESERISDFFKVDEKAVAVVKIASGEWLENYRLDYDWRENLEEGWEERLSLEDQKKEAS